MRNEYTDYISHSHKYVAAIDIGQKNGKKIKRYFYSVPEYQAYLRGKRGKTEPAANGFKKRSGYNPVKVSKNPITNAAATAATQWGIQKERGRAQAEKMYKFAKKTEQKTKEASNKFKEATRLIEDKLKETGLAGSKSKEKVGAKEDVGKKDKSLVKSAKEKLAVAKLALNTAKQIRENRKNGGPEKEASSKEPKYDNPIGPTKGGKEEKKEETKPAFLKASKTIQHLVNDLGFKVKSRETSPDEDCKDINPDFNPYKYKNSMNCAWCTLAFDLRRRGLDVDAGDISKDVENTRESIQDWYEGAKWSEPMSSLNNEIDKEFTQNMDKYVDLAKKKMKEGYDAGDANTYCACEVAKKRIEDQIIKDANGDKESWGQTIVFWRGSEGVKNAGGHSIAYYQKDGKVTFYDCQTGEKIENFTDTLYNTGLVWSAADGSATYTYTDFVDCMRTDNKELKMSDKELEKAVEKGDDNADTSKDNKHKKKYINKY